MSAEHRISIKSEKKFAETFFDCADDYIYHPKTFKLKKLGRYTPDFYDKKRDVFIEVSSNLQAFFSNRKKYIALIEEYANIIKFEVRMVDGKIIDPFTTIRNHTKQIDKIKEKVTITINHEVLRMVCEQAKQEGRNISNMIQRLVELAFAKKGR